ncbi:MAG: hypothetical protein US50_C0005G0026 [Candidatus Nomurabacteria bacterium GW2011_GWB1_37_5]|uniref:Uncharacterized protein n=1 Tax=Candidatus Nomurabacteria bacterium GW2011_GWB1_37_5 TaxID=1618742 RepID=A0A0G0HB87_9BACT|nr:MAG: hypothetical protein US50_C0005G0026 [Candidatus Nomurabacteria bacterium GW2011_GWB1_37_5]
MSIKKIINDDSAPMDLVDLTSKKVGYRLVKGFNMLDPETETKPVSKRKKVTLHDDPLDYFRDNGSDDIFLE